MWDELMNWFSGTGFMPHGHCYLWTPSLLVTYVAADLIIAAAYYSIPMALIYFVKKRHDLQFNWIFVMFSAFIFACGTTHLIAVWTIWQPVYWLDASVKAVTAAVSIITAVILWPLVPRALKLPSPEQLQSVITQLKQEMTRTRTAESALAELNRTLEHRIEERTAELSVANAALSKEIDTRKAAEARLVHALHEKELLLGEIHHRVKNNLQIVTSLLNLKSSSTTDETARNILNDCRARVGSMAMIHQALYQTNNYSAVNFAEVIKTLCDNLVRTYSTGINKVDLQLQLQEVELPINVAISCSLMVNELVTNSLKHAFPDNRDGTITVTLARLDRQFEIAVSDDGVGTPEVKLAQSDDSLGMTLIAMLADQIGAEFQSRPRNPTRFSLRVALP